LQSRDSSLVSTSEPHELERVREKWLRGKLKLMSQEKAELDAAITAVGQKMAPEKGNKSRVTFYYRLCCTKLI
jgi:hypothetical protein